ncbi:tetratricopeptide repeat protein [Mucilaginibacter sp. Bleaf8]|uniref:tetratricopeptide repeat protein n=1 Tax=Mucilaginibacter sp. Bleaf8 TaxID=2834430 RepID=UPI001BCD87EB|nr:tetratricopeptide repeat protein [Mucilaginibacter sp. Bleaf8]MBS7566242.1 tetratricopeptide repeat protein [Mucilaginibacter sp. Bleaf8]
MFTNKVRLLVIAVFSALLVFFITQRSYELAAIAGLFIGMLIWGYFKEGPIILAAKHFHNKDYDKTESLLRQIQKPEWLSKNRRGFYEFMMGGIAFKKHDFEHAEHHYEQATKYPLRSVNDHVSALATVANISLRNGKPQKAAEFLQKTYQFQDKTTARMKAVIASLEEELKKVKAE